MSLLFFHLLIGPGALNYEYNNANLMWLQYFITLLKITGVLNAITYISIRVVTNIRFRNMLLSNIRICNFYYENFSEFFNANCIQNQEKHFRLTDRRLLTVHGCSGWSTFLKSDKLINHIIAH